MSKIDHTSVFQLIIYKLSERKPTKKDADSSGFVMVYGEDGWDMASYKTPTFTSGLANPKSVTHWTSLPPKPYDD